MNTYETWDMTDRQRISPETQSSSWPPRPGPEPSPPALPRSFCPQKKTPSNRKMKKQKSINKSKPTPHSSKFANFPISTNQIPSNSTHSHYNPNPPAPNPRSPNKLGKNTIKPRRQRKHSLEREKQEDKFWREGKFNTRTVRFRLLAEAFLCRFLSIFWKPCLEGRKVSTP